MTYSRDDEPVTREEFDAVSNQVGRLTEEITDLKDEVKEIKQRFDNLEGRDNDRGTRPQS